jgi:hypothetical protein
MVNMYEHLIWAVTVLLVALIAARLYDKTKNDPKAEERRILASELAGTMQKLVARLDKVEADVNATKFETQTNALASRMRSFPTQS